MSTPSDGIDRSESTDLHVEATQRLMEALIESENRMRRRINLLADVVFETDDAGRLVFLSDAWGDLTGLAVEDSLGRTLPDHLAPESRDDVARLLFAEGGATKEVRSSFTHVDGRKVWIQISASNIASGGLVGVVHDCTQEKQVQDEVAMLSAVASSTDNLVIITNEQGLIEWVNPAFERRTEWKLSSVAGCSPGSFLQGPDTSTQTISHLREGIRAGQSIHEEILNYTRSGEPYWVALDITPIRNDEGEITRFISVQAETTQRKRYEQEILFHRAKLEERVLTRTADLARAKEEAEAAMRSNQEFTVELSKAYESLQEAQRQRRDLLDRMRSLSRRIGTGDGERLDLDNALTEVGEALGVTFEVDRVLIQLVDGEGQPGGHHVWKRPGGEANGAVESVAVDSSDLARVFAFLAVQRQTIVTSDIDEWAGLPDGDAAQEFARTVGASSALLCSIATTAGVPLGAILLGDAGRGREWRDDDIVLVEAAASDFGRAVVSANLFYGQQAHLRDLVELDRAKDEMLSTFSHELRTPLTSIRAYIELLRDGEFDDDQDRDRMMEIVEQNSVRLTGLIEDILTLSHLDSAVLQTALVDLEIDPLLDDVGAVMAPSAESKGVTLSIEGGAPGALVRGDTAQLERLMFNLLSNAIKFTDSDGSVVVRSRCDGGSVQVSVSDSGMGIPPAQQREVFGRFVRAPNATNQAIAGTGLGLSIAQAIVEHHGGSIELTSEVDVGTMITVTLPHSGALRPSNGSSSSA